MISYKYRPNFKEVIIFRLLIIILLVSGFVWSNYRLSLFIVSGFISGLYYGWCNDFVWDTNTHPKKDPNYRSHQIWVHAVCGIVGATALDLLLCNFNLYGNEIYKFTGTQFLLFMLALLGYTGLLARTLWSFANASELIVKKFIGS